MIFFVYSMFKCKWGEGDIIVLSFLKFLFEVFLVIDFEDGSNSFWLRVVYCFWGLEFYESDVVGGSGGGVVFIFSSYVYDDDEFD